MKWLEIIELRTVGDHLKIIEPELRNLIEEINTRPKERTIITYNRLALNSDFSIHLHHNSIEADIDGSPLGLHLVSILKAFGLINHSTWIEHLTK
jgi:hypothetical protein